MTSDPKPPGTDTVLQMHELTHDECLALLAENHFGRVAVGMRDDAPMIRPVSYVFDNSSKSVMFRTGHGSKLWAVRHADHAAFEIDGIDPETRTGWSVVIAGATEEVRNPAEIARLDQLGLERWVPWDVPSWIRIRAFRVSGRRLVRLSGRWF